MMTTAYNGAKCAQKRTCAPRAVVGIEFKKLPRTRGAGGLKNVVGN